MRPACHLRRSTHAFTLLELIVVIVILGLLAALAIPTFSENIAKSHDEVAQLELESFHEEAWALHRLDNTTTYTVAYFVQVEGDYSDAIGATQSAQAAGVFAQEAPVQEESSTLKVLPAGVSSEAHGNVSIATNADGDVVGLAMRSRSGRCAWVQGSTGAPTLQGAQDAADGGCVAAAVVPETDTPVGGDPGEPTETLIDAEAASGTDSAIPVSWDHVDGVVSYTATCTGASPSVSAGTSDPVVVAGEAVGAEMTVTITGLENWVTHTCTVVGATATEPIGSDEPNAVPGVPGDIVTPTDPFAPATPADHLPDPTGDGTAPPVETILEPEPSPADPAVDDPTDGIGTELGLWAAASFPSAHPNPPHRLYVTARDAGTVLLVTDDDAGAADVNLLFAPGTFDDPTGIVAGPTPSHAHAPDSHVLDALYVTDTGAGTLVRIDPGTRERYTVASGFTSPMDVAISGCWDAAGTKIQGTCALVVDDTGTHQVNLVSGAKTPIAGAPAGDGLIAAPGPQTWVAGTRSSMAGGSVGTVAASGMTGGQAVGSTIYVADTTARRIVLADTNGAATATWGSGSAGYGDGPVATATFTRPTDVHYHGQAGVTYVVDGNCVRKVDAGTVSSLYCGAAPTPGWVTAATNTAGGGINGVTTIAQAPDGGVVVGGSYFDSAPPTFGSITLPAGIRTSGFIAKADADGNWLWATLVDGAGTSADQHVRDIEVAPDGSIYAVGSFTMTATFFHAGAPTTVVASLVDHASSANTSGHAWVARYSSTGSLAWAREAARNDRPAGVDTVAVAADGSAIVSGSLTQFSSPLALFGTLSWPGTGSGKIYAAKINAAGTWQWVNAGGSASYDAPNESVATADGGAVLVGSVSGGDPTTFGSHTVAALGTSGRDGLVAKVGPTGTWEWIKVFGGGQGYEELRGVDLDSTGNIVFGGHYYTYNGAANVTIGSASWPYKLDQWGSPITSSFVAELSADGSTFQWATRLENQSPWNGIFVRDVAVAPGDAVVVVGDLDYDPGAEYSVHFGGLVASPTGPWGMRAFLARTDASGAFTSATFAGDPPQYGQVTFGNVASSASGTHVFGRVAGPIQTSTGSFDAPGSEDGVLVRLDGALGMP